MRYTELLESTEEDRLRDLEQQHLALEQRWFKIVQSNPPPPDSNANSDDPWWNDPERGGVWRKHLLPLRKEIEDLERAIRQQREGARRDAAGFNLNEVLYHGTNEEFSAFDRSKGRTAEHIYTSPDLATASEYGSHVYACYGRQEPQANLTVESGNHELLRKVHRRGRFTSGWGFSYRELAELVFDGQMYQSQASSNLQDTVLSICFDMGYRSVRFTDPKPGGSFSDSVVFDDPNDLRIVEQLS